MILRSVLTGKLGTENFGTSEGWLYDDNTDKTESHEPYNTC